MTLSINQGGAFVRSRPDVARPDVQLYRLPMSFNSNPSKHVTQLLPDPFSGMIMTCCLCRPSCRGDLMIRSADPMQARHPTELAESR